MQDGNRQTSRRWHRARIVVTSFVVATIAAFVVDRFVPPPGRDWVLVCAIWVVFYPVARLKQSEPWWAHWARGVVILIGFWIALRLFR